MTKEEKELLLKDLCSRLPYKVKCLVIFDDGTKEIMTPQTGLPNSFGRWDFYNENCSGCSNNFKPYLRPMSSMTEDEFKELKSYSGLIYDQLELQEFHNNSKCLEFYLSEIPSYVVISVFDWLNVHHFDYRGLIPMGLALEAPEGMYK